MCIRDRENTIVKLVGQGEKIAVMARTTGLSRPTIYRVLRLSLIHISEPTRPY